MRVHVCVDDNNQVDGFSYTKCDNSIEVTVRPDIADFIEKWRHYRVVDGQLEYYVEGAMPGFREAKFVELSRECQSCINKGFLLDVKDVRVLFSYDEEAQQNFRDTYNLINDGIITEVGWTVKDPETLVHSRVILSVDEFKKAYSMSVREKLNKVSYLRDYLDPLLETITDVDSLSQIQWDYTQKEFK